MKIPKQLPCRLNYTKTKKKRNVFIFDAGFHTLNMKPKKGELDCEFVTRFLVEYFNGCRKRGDKMYQDYFLWHDKKENYITCWGVKK